MAKKEKKDPTEPVRMRKQTALMVREIAEATGRTLWAAVDDLFGPGLEQEWKAIQPKLKKIREQQAKIEALQKEARRS